ncbi:hypothetical protein R6Q59_021663 [Mikania micrantha]
MTKIPTKIPLLVCTDVLRLKKLGVCGYGIDHLVIPTRDYLFAPSYDDICKAVEFIHVMYVLLFLIYEENASAGSNLCSL